MQEEPNKDDDEGPSSSTSNPNPNPNPNPCPICLGLITQDSYLDRCFHKFCYNCIIRWIQVVSSKSSSLRQPSSVKCPLCKKIDYIERFCTEDQLSRCKKLFGIEPTENISIIYGYDGSTFQRHYIDQNNGNRQCSSFFSKDHKYRLQCYYTEPESGLLSDAFKVERYWKSHKYLQPNSWLEKWLKRELQALIQEEDVQIIMHHILGVIQSFLRSYHPKGKTYSPHQKQEELKVLVADAAMPFLTARTKRFVDELELFLASGLTVEAYDRAYRKCLGWKKPEETTEDDEQTSTEREPIAPYLYFFDDDSDEADWTEDKL